MDASVRSLLLLLLSSTLLGGCAGLGATSLDGELPGPEVYNRTHQRSDGTLVSVTDYITAPGQGEACETTVRQINTMDPAGKILQRSVEWRRCGVTESRIVERYGDQGAPRLQSLAIDDDHDGAFDFGWDRGDRT